MVFLTDGMLARNAAEISLPELLLSIRAVHPREVVQALDAAVLEASAGDLRDDTTVLCPDWHGGPRRRRNSSGGADEQAGGECR
jgi:hypothetical protein